MSFHRCAIFVALLAGVSASPFAQTLGEVARRTAEARKGTEPATKLEARDVSPAAAREDFLQYRLTPARWTRFLAADREVARVVAANPALLASLEGLNYTTIRSAGHFFGRDRTMAAVLKKAGVDPHDYAYTYLAAKLALSKETDALAAGPQANLAFIKGRAPELKGLALSLDVFSLHALRSPAPPPPLVMPGDPVLPRRRADAADASPANGYPPDDGGPIAMAVGSQIPDFAFVDFVGNRRQLADFRGRYLMLDFWGSWCPPCRAEIPYVKEAYTRFAPRGFDVLGMDSERSASVEQVRDYLRKNGVTWTFATPDSVRTLINDRFNIQAFPTVILLGPDGRVIESRSAALRGANLARTLDRLLPR